MAAIAKAIGFGYYTPLKMVAPEGDWGYDPNYKGRPYNPEMARKLLAEAGYPKGLKLKLLVFLPWAGGTTDSAEAIKAYLSDVGITVDIDIADPGRYFGSIWGTGWEDLALGFTGLDPTYLVTFQRWFGHDTATQLVSFKQSPELIVLSKESITYMDEADRCSRVGLIYHGQLVICDEPRRIRMMVEGEIIELRPDDWRRTREMIQDLPGVLEVQTYGEMLHIFLDSAEKHIPIIEATLIDAGISYRGLRRAPARMEEAFISLIRGMDSPEIS